MEGEYKLNIEYIEFGPYKISKHRLPAGSKFYRYKAWKTIQNILCA